MGTAENLRRRRFDWLRRRHKGDLATSMTMMEHLDELRGRLIKSLAAFLFISIAAFILYDPISKFLLEPLCSLPRDLLGPLGCRLPAFGPLEGFLVRVKVTALTGLVFASPVWLYQLWAFVTPGLTRRERRYAGPFVATSVILFVIGAAFAYLTLPTGLRVLVEIGGDAIVPFYRAKEYLDFVGLMLLGFGVTFELPVLLFFLGLAGVVRVEQLRRHRKAAFVLILVLAAVVTPSQDPYTMLIMAVPLYGLYELTIALLSRVSRRRASAS